MRAQSRFIQVDDVGLTDYVSCWDLQRRILARRAAGTLPDTLLLTEHRHVYTIGTTGDDNHLLADEAELRAAGISVFHADRGGDITYHGPGQLVGYPILNLESYYLDLHRYLRDLEEVVIRVLGGYHLKAGRSPGYTGVWIGGEKICAIGVKSSRWVTMHGFALNVSTDLSYFDRIIPCGIFEKGVTSMRDQLGHEVDMEEVKARTVEEFGNVFDATVELVHAFPEGG